VSYSAIYAEGVARIRHSATGEVYEISAGDLDWNQVAADDRQMGLEVQHEALIEHPELGLLAWRLWEYPLGVENDREVDLNGHQAVDHLDFGMRWEPDEEDQQQDEPDLAERLSALPLQLDTLERTLAELRTVIPMLGHNLPPSEHRFTLSEIEYDELAKGFATLRSELAKPAAADAADATAVAAAAPPLMRLRDRLIDWLKRGAVNIGRGALAGAGGVATKEVWDHYMPILHQIGVVLDTLVTWAAHLTAIF